MEVDDQIDVTTQLVSLYNFIDKSKVAIWGWSYGGFVTASVLARDSDRYVNIIVTVLPTLTNIFSRSPIISMEAL